MSNTSISLHSSKCVIKIVVLGVSHFQRIWNLLTAKIFANVFRLNIWKNFKRVQQVEKLVHRLQLEGSTTWKTGWNWTPTKDVDLIFWSLKEYQRLGTNGWMSAYFWWSFWVMQTVTLWHNTTNQMQFSGFYYNKSFAAYLTDEEKKPFQKKWSVMSMLHCKCKGREVEKHNSCSQKWFTLYSYRMSPTRFLSQKKSSSSPWPRSSTD